jgi:hypothetical protein
VIPGDAPVLREARERMVARGALLAGRGIAFRPVPPEPTTCCGRGCSGCVWEGFFAAVDWWCEEADALLVGVRR